MWRYIDEFVGKGLEFSVIAEFLLYTSATLVPSALPLAILMSSLMTFGNLGERYELTAMKASGISLQRIMAPMFIIVFFVSIAEFLFVNEVMPYSNLKLYTLLHDIRDKRPAVHIQEGEFYGGIDNYSIRVDRKDTETNKLYGIIIYDHSSGQNIDVTIADSGRMEVTADDANMIFTLWHGYKYVESQDFRRSFKTRTYPHQYVEFGEQKFVIKLIGYDLERTQGGLFKDHQAMLDINQLNVFMDSVKAEIVESKQNLYGELHYGNILFLDSKKRDEYFQRKNNPYPPESHQRLNENRKKMLAPGGDTVPIDILNRRLPHRSDSTLMQKQLEREREKEKEKLKAEEEAKNTNIKTNVDIEQETTDSTDSTTDAKIAESPFEQATYINPDSLLSILEPSVTLSIYNNAATLAKKAKSVTFNTVPSLQYKVEKLRRYEVEWHRKFVLSFACMIFLLLGAPLGAIIRKGGLGLPLVVSTLFFIFWYIINLTTEKMVKADQLHALFGMWLPSFIFFLLGVFLTYKATTDSQMMNMDTYTNFLKKIFGQRLRLIDILLKDMKEDLPKVELKKDKVLQSLMGFLEDVDENIETVRRNIKPVGFFLSMFGMQESTQLIMLERLYKNIMRTITKSTYIHNRPIRAKIEEYPNISANTFLDIRYKLLIKIALIFIPIIALFIIPQQKILVILAVGIAIVVILRHYILLMTLRNRLLSIQQYTRDLYKLINQSDE